NRLTDKEKEHRRKKNKCFKCGKPGQLARECRQNATQVNSHSTTLKEEWEESGTDEKIAIQSTRLIEKTRPNSLIAVVKNNIYPAKAVIDQSTIEANVISNQFCAVHNIELKPLEKPICTKMTLKGSRGSATYKVIVDINYGLYQEQDEF